MKDSIVMDKQHTHARFVKFLWKWYGEVSEDGVARLNQTVRVSFPVKHVWWFGA